MVMRPLRVRCPRCQDDALLSSPQTDCPWCGLPLVTRPEPGPRGPANRYAPESVFRKAYDLYQDGLSIRRVAAILVGETRYKDARSFSRCLDESFRTRGWPVRTRQAAVVGFNYRHGHASRTADKNEYRRWKRRDRGLRPLCAGTKLTYPNRGAQCQLPAGAGSAYCYAHDPERRGELLEQLAGMRAGR